MNDPIAKKKGFVGPTFSLGNRLRRALWRVAWMLFARWTPPPLHRARVVLVRAFGGDVSWKAYIYPDVDIWAPWNLSMADYATLGRGVICYNIGQVTIGQRAVVSQYTHLCTGTHDYRDPAFTLYARPIHIGARSWVCANAFIGPGVTVGDGAILSAAGVATHDLSAWKIYQGNPAREVKARPEISD